MKMDNSLTKLENRQAELIALMKRNARLYNMGDSSSITIELARELMQSIAFTISTYTNIHSKATLEELLESGRTELFARIDYGKTLMTSLTANLGKVKSKAYTDTVTELREFFRRYDAYFMSHEIPCSIDYQLCIPVEETKLGIEYIISYLESIILENSFINDYPSDNLARVLSAHSADYLNSVENLFYPVFANWLAYTLLHGEGTSILLTHGDESTLLHMLTNMPSPMLEFIKHVPDVRYIQNAACQLWPRIEAALTGRNTRVALQHIFTFTE